MQTLNLVLFNLNIILRFAYLQIVSMSFVTEKIRLDLISLSKSYLNLVGEFNNFNFLLMNVCMSPPLIFYQFSPYKNCHKVLKFFPQDTHTKYLDKYYSE